MNLCPIQVHSTLGSQVVEDNAAVTGCGGAAVADRGSPVTSPGRPPAATGPIVGVPGSHGVVDAIGPGPTTGIPATAPTSTRERVGVPAIDGGGCPTESTRRRSARSVPAGLNALPGPTGPTSTLGRPTTTISESGAKGGVPSRSTVLTTDPTRLGVIVGRRSHIGGDVSEADSTVSRGGLVPIGNTGSRPDGKR